MGRHGRFYAAPSPHDDRPIQRKTVRRVVATFRPYRRKVAVVALAIVVTSGLGVVNPLLIKWVFDQRAVRESAGGLRRVRVPPARLLYFYVGMMIVIPIVTSIIGIGQTYLANLVGLRVMQDLRNSLYEHLQAMPLRFFTTTRTGEIQSRLANDVGGRAVRGDRHRLERPGQCRRHHQHPDRDAGPLASRSRCCRCSCCRSSCGSPSRSGARGARSRRTPSRPWPTSPRSPRRRSA